MTDIKQITGFLHRVALFSSLTNKQIDMIAKRFVEREYPAGSEIVTQGMGGEGFFVVVSGKAQIKRKKSDGSVVELNVIQPGDFLGEMALLDDGLRAASAVALEPTKCLLLTRVDFRAVLKEDSEMAIAVLQEMAKRFRAVLDSM
jgi:CRP/FNR family cyclic AMP-dependent transcriptional regulator